MIFEVDGFRVIQSLDPYQGPRFTEPIDDVEGPNFLDQLYALTAGKREDYINPTMTGSISWRSVQSKKVGSDVAMEDWQQGDHEIHSRHCTTIRCLC